MPIYEYRCDACGHLEEVFAKMADPPPAACEQCGTAELVKVLFPVSVQYKGSGFYSTDYGSSRRGAGGGTDTSDGGGGESSAKESSGESSGGSSSTTESASPSTSASDT